MKIDCREINGEDPITMASRPECIVSAWLSAEDGDMDAAGVHTESGRVVVCIVLPDLGDKPANTTNLPGSTIASRVRAACDAARGLL